MTEAVADLLKKLTDAHEATQKQLIELQQQVTSSQTASMKLVVQKIEEERGYTFRKKGHEKQWRFNKAVDNHLDNALDELKKMPRPTDEKTSKIVDNVQEELAKGREEIADRQKKIKMADRSEYSWGMVEAYERDELADDSADEKRMEKAEKEAERSAGKKKKTKRSRAPSASRQEGPDLKKQPHWEPPERPAVPARFPSQLPLRQKPQGPCWSCGKFGHLAAACPQTSKWYPFVTPGTPGDSCYPPGGSHSDTNVECMHEFNFTGTEKITDSPAELAPRTAEVAVGFEEEIPEPVASTAEGSCSAERSWEIEEAVGEQAITVVKGRLRQHIKFWKEVIKAPAYIIDCIQNGYKLPLFTEPPPHRQSNSASALKHKEFVTEAVSELFQNGCVKKVEACPHICSPLSVVVNPEGKKRLVINLRYLNQFLKKESFKYEDLRTLLSLLKAQDYLCKFDLKSGYHHVDITTLHWKYLGFQWGTNDGQQYYMFTVLPFGLASACYIFTKLIRPLVRMGCGQ